MNQQRSRRFRASQEAKEKEEARKESIAMWEGVYDIHGTTLLRTDGPCVAMGKTLSEDEKNKKSWDSNAITPGTPFMDLLAASLRYWVVMKMNQDPGWKDVRQSAVFTFHCVLTLLQLEVIISDASVPGEGEHKIMDFIRRQRSNPGHDPNTHHVIYGLVSIPRSDPGEHALTVYRTPILSCLRWLRTNHIFVSSVRTSSTKREVVLHAESVDKKVTMRRNVRAPKQKSKRLLLRRSLSFFLTFPFCESILRQN